MGILGRKPKMSIEEFCQDFYDRFFDAKVNSIDVGAVFFNTAFDQVAEADRSFAKVDRVLFRREMTALRVELFGLAWMHYFKGKKLDKYSLREISFTKKYLESTGRIEIWDIMLFYNKAIGKSGYELCAGEKARRAWNVSLESFKMNLYGKLRTETEFDKDCIARVLNRLGTDVVWERKITLELLTALCAKRSGCAADLDPEAFFRLSVPIYGMYNGAMDAIKSAKVSL